MTPVELSEAADTDIEEILLYGIERFGVETAEAYVRGFDDCFDLISDHPAIGAVHETVRPPIHSLPHGSHRIYYDVLPDRIVVRRVLHKAMDVERWL
ncbi:type II toxin-antitoxin system RelE/ParE family toxin [Stakelama sediminis]|uniref:Toxin n=1 Tax=Stakelama sediminis TaxID=463200 RepID=A0A840Z039_9SPHN|nr:type II toxin-antitoxin system RelE/ParE family toxin [Stakelama sediminis]MBB5719245.1 toxin ParE1/3/4 [Stakelama sediminis]